VRTCYADDPAACYLPRGSGRRETVLMARMHKAAAVMQFKLEGQLIARRPEYGLDNRRLLHTIDRRSGTIEIDGRRWPLRDTHFPTLDADLPYELSPDVATCLARIRQSFLHSQSLWSQMRFLVQRGAMAVVRDDALIFHGCLAVDEQGDFQDVPLPAGPCAGREMFRRIEQLVPRALRAPSAPDLDFLWYLWCGPRSPLFGKDRITTLENDLIADPATHVETKNPYFRLIHEVDFCDRVLAEFGVDRRRGLIVNGHVPVRIDAGESPLKRSGKAVTIDGAFSEAYGDRGYTLLLEPDCTLLAEHHHFDSVDAAVEQGVDIIPSITLLRQEGRPRLVAETEQGQALRGQIALLERLVTAYQTGLLPVPAGE
jgi:fructose-1,6-bisphosphatase-3